MKLENQEPDRSATINYFVAMAKSQTAPVQPYRSNGVDIAKHPTRYHPVVEKHQTHDQANDQANDQKPVKRYFAASRLLGPRKRRS